MATAMEGPVTASRTAEDGRLLHSAGQLPQEPLECPGVAETGTPQNTAPAQPTTNTADDSEDAANKLSEKKLEPQKEHMPDPASAAFECNICLELAKDPVVTLCGHLYCWPCLYRWMQIQNYCRQCPVCKAGVEVDKVVPIYGRGSENPEPAQDVLKLQPLPPRPVGQRLPPIQLPVPQHGNQPPVTQQQQPQGVLPALFGFQLGPGQGYVEALTPEQQHQAFLSRLLLMLGSFVIMCLLLF